MRLLIRSALLSLSVLAAMAPSTPLAAQGEAAPELDALLRSFRSLPGLSARFREEKHVALLAAPLRSEGEIHFAPPDRLLRRVTTPTRSVALIADGRLTLVSDGRREQFDLTRQPLVAGFVDSFRHVLAGDREALERSYRIAYTREDDGRWRLTLRPRAAPLNQFLREMTFEGRGVQVRRMRMLEVSGDETRTEFYDVDTTRRWSPEEIRRVFRVD